MRPTCPEKPASQRDGRPAACPTVMRLTHGGTQHPSPTPCPPAERPSPLLLVIGILLLMTGCHGETRTHAARPVMTARGIAPSLGRKTKTPARAGTYAISPHVPQAGNRVSTPGGDARVAQAI
ncbi:hypothetical protein [Novacetimonas maltaceti]|uniref:Uncharacterized protein n=1 Tax=Novacetimonas maltaceti TaxID=1203393 RepID=A0A2S3W1T0_9PROT|nr:hypothetical protein [Novacetimonas maltaceti]POF62832.1 hypothetical protein KMAL_15550 [Novacetimonas maltaceti]